MTEVTIVTSRGCITGFTLSGHANYNNQGPDILCSAISMASLMTANGLEVLTNATITSVTRDGYFSVKVHSGYDEVEVRALLDSFKLGMRNLEEQYPSHIKIQCFEE